MAKSAKKTYAQTKDAAFRQRRYDAGYKQMRIWVPRDSEGKVEKLERRLFTARVMALTAGWSKAKLSKLFSQLLQIVKEQVREAEGK